jgi:LacI family transcriptional regulator
VRLALSQLAQKGYIYKQHGRGTFTHRVETPRIKPIGLLACEPEKLGNPYFVDLIRGLNTYLTSVGSYVSVISQPPREWASHLIHSVDGVVVVPTPLRQEDIGDLERWGKPYLIASDSELQGPAILYDVETAARRLTEGLLEFGHRKFGIISGHRQHSDLLKKRGIAAALEKAGISFSAIPNYLTNFDVKLGRQAAQDLLESRPETTALIATDDVLAISAIQVAQQCGRKVPFNLSVVGFNDLAISALVSPALTTVHFPVVSAGRRAAEVLCLKVLKGEPVTSTQIGHEIIWRQSTAPAPSALGG